MTHWTRPFLAQALASIPQDEYRQCLEAELTDHLEALARELEENGYTPPSARTIALGRIGDPAALGKGFLEEWRRRAMKPSYFLPRLRTCVGQALAMNALFLFLFLAHFPLFSREFLGALVEQSPFPTLLGALSFAVLTFLPGLIRCLRELARQFSFHPRRRTMVTGGLLLFWSGERLFHLSFLLLMTCLTESLPSLRFQLVHWNGLSTVLLYLLLTLGLSLLFALGCGLRHGDKLPGGETP